MSRSYYGVSQSAESQMGSDRLPLHAESSQTSERRISQSR